MAILPPPYIPSKLSAQYNNQLKIEFTTNRAVGRVDSLLMQLKLKTVSTNRIISILTSKEFPQRQVGDNYEIIFDLEESLTPGQFYKVQLAFIDNGDIGTFSSVGTFKYTYLPTLTLIDSKNKELVDYENNPNFFIGKFVSEDSTERVSEYQFEIYTESGELFDSSGFLIHDIENDRIDEITHKNYSIDSYDLYQELNSDVNYYVIYSVKTTNGAYVSSRRYWLKAQYNISVPFPGYFRIANSLDEGYLKMDVIFTTKKILSGSFRILRTSEKSNFLKWEAIYKFSFSNKSIVPNETMELFKDYTVEQGIKYQYAIQQYTDTIRVKKTMCTKWMSPNGEEIEQSYFVANFDCMFLYDGQKQLKINFNPKISSFKNTILESKIETLGSKYPFFFRNGVTNYKEFPISGLITYWMDSSHIFSNYENYSTNLDFDNIVKERQFKLTVLEWLSNGKPKLFRSPTEGNYIIRLTNVNLKPNDTLGRMIHTFDAKAYEIAECTFSNFLNYHFLTSEEHFFKDISYDVQNFIEQPIINLASSNGAVTARIINGKLGQQYKLTFREGEPIIIIIGYTGQYNIIIDEDNPLLKVECITQQADNKAQLEYAYIAQDNSKKILNENNQEMTNFSSFSGFEQFIGEQSNIIEALVLIKSHNNPEKNPTLIDSIPYIRLQTRPIIGFFQEGQDYYKDDATAIDFVKLSRIPIYFNIKTQVYYQLSEDGQSLIELETKVPDNSYSIKEKSSKETITSYLTSNRIELDLSDKIISILATGNAIVTDIFYRGNQYSIINS